MRRFTVLLALSTLVAGCAVRDRQALLAGDILFTVADHPSEQDLAIQQATHSARPWAHNGLVLEKDGELQVLEAAWPRGVHWTKVPEFMAQWGTVLTKSPREKLTPEQVARVHRAGVAYLGRPYDGEFYFSDDAIYCSELVWKAYQRGLGVELSPAMRMKEFDVKVAGFDAFAAKKWGASIPWEEPMIANEALWQSQYLKEGAFVVGRKKP